MRIQALNLIAFGPFTDVVLDFNKGRQGLHVVYGLNEAGKSTALRSLQQMLYGIPTRSKDDFIHPYANLRIGATLRLNDGSEISFIRRKGNIKTLRADDDQTVLDESEISRYLGGISQEMFSLLFGIDHDRLIQGGREIVQGGGAVGRVLFGAGTGITALRLIQEELQGDMGGLFKPSAQNPSINFLIAEFKKNRKALKEAELPGEEWDRQVKNAEETTARNLRVEEDLSERKAELSRLERIKAALPSISRRIELEKAFEEYADAPQLREGFSEQHHALLSELRVAERENEQASRTVGEVAERLKKTAPPGKILDRAKIIDTLYREYEVHRKSAADRIRLVTQRDHAQNEAKEILAGLRDDMDLSAAEDLRLKNTEIALIRELGSRYGHLCAAVDSARSMLRKLSDAIETIESRIKTAEPPMEIDTLKSDVESAADIVPLENQYRDLCEEVRQDRASIESGLSNQSIWRDRASELTVLSLPAEESLGLFIERFSRLRQEIGGVETEIRNTEKFLLEIAGKLDGLELEQAVPTEGELLAAREKRETGWRLVRLSWLENVENQIEVEKYLADFPGGSTLSDAYEATVAHADLLADRLRREADRVTRKAALLTDQGIHRKQFGLLQKRHDALGKDIAILTEEWRALWKSLKIQPLSPEEMTVWTRQMSGLKERAAVLQQKHEKTDRINGKIEQHKQVLRRHLEATDPTGGTSGETLSGLVKQCQKIIHNQGEIRNRYTVLLNEKNQREKDFSSARLELADAQTAMDRWHEQWERAIQPLGLPGTGTTPAQAGVFLDDLKELFNHIKDARGFDKRIRGIDRDAEDYNRRVKELVSSASQDLEGMPVDQAIMELNSRLDHARDIRRKHQGYQEQRLQAEQRLDDSSKRIRVFKDQLSDLCNEAGCQNIAELPETERRSEKRLRIETDRDTIDDQLRGLSAGATVEVFIKEARGVDPDTIDTRIERLQEEIKSLQDQRDSLQRTLWEAQAELDRMDGSARAAELAEEGQRLLGKIDRDVEKYARLRVAAYVLNTAIERFREKNQGPLVERAGALFSLLTAGAFGGIRTDFDTSGEPVLVGFRPGGRELVLVDEMSDGTADQLYLALRLASIEQLVENSEPLPFIVDDILIRFDDERSAGTLKVLAELSAKTQVIFFTHHRHLVDLARKNVGPDILFVHSL